MYLTAGCAPCPVIRGGAGLSLSSKFPSIDPLPGLSARLGAFTSPRNNQLHVSLTLQLSFIETRRKFEFRLRIRAKRVENDLEVNFVDGRY